MGSYGSRLDILAGMLRAVSQGAKKTRIVYQTDLGYKLLIKYLTEVIESCLIRFERGTRDIPSLITLLIRPYRNRYTCPIDEVGNSRFSAIRWIRIHSILTLGGGSAALFGKNLEKHDSCSTRPKISKAQSSDLSLAL